MSIGKTASIEDIKKLKAKYPSLFTKDVKIPGFDADKFGTSDCLINIKVKDYNHLVNERDWYKKRMEQYRDFISWIEKQLKNLSDFSTEFQECYERIHNEYARRF